MSEEHRQRTSSNTYLMDQQTTQEMARLLLQERLVTRSMGGLFPEGFDLMGMHDVLDVACGPGGWALEVAQRYPHTQIVALDIDRTQIDYARTQAQAQGLDNAHFRVMDATKPLKFPDASFDYINARLLFSFLLPAAWPRLLQECRRILRPGGFVRLTECEAAFTCHAPSFAQLESYLMEALARAGRTYASDGRAFGITPLLSRFLRQAGFQGLQRAAYTIDWSFASDAYESSLQNSMIGFPLIRPFLLKMQIASEEDLLQLEEQALQELQSPDFSAIWYYLSVWGQKPKGLLS